MVKGESFEASLSTTGSRKMKRAVALIAASMLEYVTTINIKETR